MAGGYPKGTEAGEYDYINQLSSKSLSTINYKTVIEKSYRLLATDKLRKMVAEYNAKSPYARMFEISKAEKIEHKVAVHILKERKGLERMVKP